jgi:hypothetical protein
MQFDEGGERDVDLALGAGLQDRELHPLRTRRFLHVSDEALGSRVVRVHQQGDHPGLRNQLGKQLEPLGHHFELERAEAREVAARTGRLATSRTLVPGVRRIEHPRGEEARAPL